jgi:hypothetical protein
MLVNLQAALTLYVRSLSDYTVVRDDAGLYAYAKLADDGRLVASNEMVGRPLPKSAKKKMRPPPENRSTTLDGSVASSTTAVEAKTKRRKGRPKGGNCGQGGRFLRGSGNTIQRSTTDRSHRRTATVGTLKNLVILIKFRDHNRRTLPTKDEIDILMNSEEADPIYAPTGSLKMVYWENSYGQLTINSYVADWIRVSRPEAYYAAGESGVGSNRVIQEALIEALNELERRGFDFSQFDQDNDFHIDSITFMTSGYGAEWGGGEFDIAALALVCFDALMQFHDAFSLPSKSVLRIESGAISSPLTGQVPKLVFELPGIMFHPPCGARVVPLLEELGSLHMRQDIFWDWKIIMTLTTLVMDSVSFA